MNKGLLTGPIGSHKSISREVYDYIRAEYVEASTNNLIVTISTSTWTTLSLNTFAADDSGIAKLVGNRLIIPTGKYKARAAAQAHLTGATGLRIRDVANGVTLSMGQAHYLQGSRSWADQVLLVDVFTAYRPATIELQIIAEAAGNVGVGTTSLGFNSVKVMIELIRIGN